MQESHNYRESFYSHLHGGRIQRKSPADDGRRVPDSIKNSTKMNSGGYLYVVVGHGSALQMAILLKRKQQVHYWYHEDVCINGTSLVYV